MEQASSRLGELVDRARHGHERVVLTEHGQPAAVLISVDELDDEFMASLDLDVTP
ncbi:MAG: type II toxin-antitoxin system Phd/YefM family antitoxin [Streptosporangiaceae bacterium]